MLAAVAGAWCGALGFWLWPQDVGPEGGLLALGLGFVMVAWYGLPRILGLFLILAGMLWGLAAWEVSAHKGLNWNDLSRKSHWVVGRVDAMTPQADNPKRVTLALSPVRFFGVENGHLIDSVRIGAWTSQLDGVGPGRDVAAQVKLIPPDGPGMPLERDGRLWAWLQPTFVTGYVQGTLSLTLSADRYFHPPTGVAGWVARASAGVEQARRQIYEATLPLSQGVVAALLMGDQRAVTPALLDAYRTAGLGHLLAISGMQMTLVGLGLFWMLRRGMALWTPLTLRFNLKFWAAILTLPLVLGYALLAGASVSVLRAMVMVALVLLAYVAGRLSHGLRTWSVANLAILLVNPIWAMSAGMQLSSAAVLGLLLWARTEPPVRGWAGWARATALSTVVAGAVTAPIAALQFGTFAYVGLLANMVAIPLMTLATYAGMAALALWPVGLAPLALMPMSFLVDIANQWTLAMANLSGAPVVLGYGGAAVLAGVGVATLVAVLWRAWAVLAAVVGLSSAFWVGWTQLDLPPQRLIVDGGRTALAYDSARQQWRILWAERVGDARYAARRLDLPLAALREAPSVYMDEHEMPVYPGAFAYAEYDETPWRRGWRVIPLACGRVWHRVDVRCADNADVPPAGVNE